MLRSKYCWVVGILSALLGYWFVVKPFLTPFSPLYIVVLSYGFLVLFALSVSCMIRNIKMTVKSMKGASLVSILAYVLGFASIQTCFASGVCMTKLTVPLIATLFPSFMRGFLEQFSMVFLVLAIAMIGYSLYSMGCFKKNEPEKKFVVKLK